MKKTAVAMKKSKYAKAKTFFEDNRSRLIDTLSRADVMKMADLLLQNKCITDATYETIHKEPLQPDNVRTLYHAMKPGDLQSYLVCYEYLEKWQPCIIENLEGRTGDETASDSEPLRKKARIEEPDQTQVQDATNETDSGSTPNFTGWTRSKLLEYVEDPVNIKHLVTSLEQRLEDREMEQLESMLHNCALKNTVFLNHEAFRDICINKELSNFLISKSQAKFPKLAIDQFFTGGFKTRRPKPLRTQDEPEKDYGDSGTMQNRQSAELSRMQEESFDQNSLNSPGVQDMTWMDTELSLPTAQSTPCHFKRETNSIRMQKSLSVSSDNGYDTQNSSLSIYDPPQEAQREFKTSMGTLTTPSECQQSISGEAVTEDGATTSEATSAATPAAIASAVTPSIRMQKSLTVSSDNGYDTLTQKSSLSIHDPPQEAQREFKTSMGTLTTLSECQQSISGEAVAEDGATTSEVTSAATPAAIASAATPAAMASAATPAAMASAATPAALASAATPAAIASAATPAAMASAATPAVMASAATPAALASAATPAAIASAAKPAALASAVTPSIRMQKSLTVSSDNGYDTSTQKSSLSIHNPPQEAQREFKTSMGTLTTPSECQQSISGEAVAEDGATTSEVTSAATPAAMASAATPAGMALAATPAAVVSAAIPAAMASAATPAALASAATPATIPSAATPAAIASAATPAALASAATPAAMSSAATAKSADTASSPTADTVPAIIPAYAASSVAVAANGGLTNNGNPRKQQNRKVCKKTTEEMRRNNQKDILHKFFLKQIPLTSGTGQETEELKKIKDCIRIVDCREHPSYPLLLADHCIVFHEANQKKLIEILDSAAFKKNGQLKEEFRFKVQFHMWLLDISKTVVLSKKEDSPSVEIQADYFEAEEKRFQQYLHKVVVPLFAVYKKVQREREL